MEYLGLVDWIEGSESNTMFDSTSFKIAQQLAGDLHFITLSGKDHDMFYFHKGKKIWIDIGEDAVWDWMAKMFPSHPKKMLNEVIHHMQGQTLTPRDNFHPPKGWMCFKNIALDTLNRYTEVFPCPEDYIRNRIPVNYNSKARCPEFLKFIKEVLPDIEDRLTLIEALSLVFIPGFNFEKAIMFIGKSSANGKSTIMKILRKIIGDQNTVSISLQDLVEDRFMGQRLDGKLLNIYADINAKQIKDLDKFKLMVSGDFLTVQRKNGHPYEIVPTAKHYFSTNTLPMIDEDNDAVYRRFLIIDFPISFEDRKDLDLLDRLTSENELEGIVNLLVKTSMYLSKRRNFTHPQTPQDIRMRWKQESDAVFELINKSQMLIKDKSKRITHGEFYTVYTEFCKSKKYLIKSPATVARQMTKHGIETQNSNGERYYLGLSKPKEVEAGRLDKSMRLDG